MLFQSILLLAHQPIPLLKRQLQLPKPSDGRDRFPVRYHRIFIEKLLKHSYP
ncbi:hypothetical protein AVDCRST_MAG92-1062 [uncultured Coleofasciculus sp.]|uniref:Uncharacterized protein n=1 Tax=uncultured Coleofasciculus sp. TaxID=1267456 RepID=A0A6J4HS27_9CYAN|nr:hypothetical protein AVDCRST_MAG92-1062 [uncultured Coleofasciculus sp.]